jgi:hypothetical protein
MTEHLSPESLTSTPEITGIPHLTKGELDDIELQVREMAETNITHNDLRALTSALLEAKGQPPLAEGEDRRAMLIDIDGETIEQAIFVDPKDFGTFVRSISEMGIPNQSEATSDGAAKESDEEPSTEHLNEDSMALAYRKLEELQEVSHVEQRIIQSMTEELAATTRRDMVDMNAAEQTVQTIWRRLSSLVEETDTAMRAMVRIDSELDTRSSVFQDESDKLDKAANIIRSSSRALEEEAVYPVRILLRVIDDARSDPQSMQQFKSRSAEVLEQVKDVLNRQKRMLQEVTL